MAAKTPEQKEAFKKRMDEAKAKKRAEAEAGGTTATEKKVRVPRKQTPAKKQTDEAKPTPSSTDDDDEGGWLL